jgi:hypothetical protein
MVQIHPDPPSNQPTHPGAIAQLGERLLCKQEVTGSIPVGSTKKGKAKARGGRRGNRGISNQRRGDARLFGASSSGNTDRLIFNNLG